LSLLVLFEVNLFNFVSGLFLDDKILLEIRNFDERLSPDLSQVRGKSIGEDLDIDDEGSEQNIEHLQSLYYCSIGYQSVRHELTSLRRLIPTSIIDNTSKNEEDAI
jgi:hypothetical protein